MSSSPPTESPLTEARSARWNPAGWPLRTRLVAIMIGLLVILGLAVGSAAEIYLHKALYDRVDAQLDEASRAARGFPPQGQHGGPGLSRPGFVWADRPPGGVRTDSVILGFTLTGTGTVSVL